MPFEGLMLSRNFPIPSTPHVSDKTIQNSTEKRTIYVEWACPKRTTGQSGQTKVPRPGGHVQCFDSALLPFRWYLHRHLRPYHHLHLFRLLFRPSALLWRAVCSYNERTNPAEPKQKPTHSHIRQPGQIHTDSETFCICEYQCQCQCACASSERRARYTDTQILGTHTAIRQQFACVCVVLELYGVWPVWLWALAFTLRCVFHIAKAKAVLRTLKRLTWAFSAKKILYSEQSSNWTKIEQILPICCN